MNKKIIVFLLGAGMTALFCGKGTGTNNNKPIFPKVIELGKVACYSDHSPQSVEDRGELIWENVYNCTMSNGTFGTFKTIAGKNKGNPKYPYFPSGLLSYINLNSCSVNIVILKTRLDFVSNKQNVKDLNLLLETFAEHAKEHEFCR
ncbi:MAG: hypothetical protein GY754_04490 [bacterium]|nr:hypothetical protein [bacterium]